MDVCLRGLKETTKVGSTATVSRTSVLIISHITFRDCRVHSFCDNLSRNSCILLRQCSAGSRPRDKGWGGGGGRWGDPVSKKFFSALWASVWSKNEGGGGWGRGSRAPPLDPPLQCCLFIVGEFVCTVPLRHMTWYSKEFLTVWGLRCGLYSLVPSIR